MTRRCRPRPWTRAVAVAGPLLLAVVGAGSVAVPAHAAEEAGLSFDRRSWSDSLRAPLFDPAATWVPGDRETRSFYLRNGGPSAAGLTIDVRSPGGDDRLADDLDISARPAGGTWAPVLDGRPGTPLTAQALDAGGVLRVDVAVRFRRESGNPTQHDQLPLEFAVALTQAGRAGDGAHADDSGMLPGTGSALGRGLLWLGAVLLGGGLAILRSRRREHAVVRDG